MKYRLTFEFESPHPIPWWERVNIVNAVAHAGDGLVTGHYRIVLAPEECGGTAEQFGQYPLEEESQEEVIDA
jgi:hypothetical protein